MMWSGLLRYALFMLRCVLVAILPSRAATLMSARGNAGRATPPTSGSTPLLGLWSAGWNWSMWAMIGSASQATTPLPTQVRLWLRVAVTIFAARQNWPTP